MAGEAIEDAAGGGVFKEEICGYTAEPVPHRSGILDYGMEVCDE